jgi:hypothetical protein
MDMDLVWPILEVLDHRLEAGCFQDDNHCCPFYDFGGGLRDREKDLEVKFQKRYSCR